MSSSLSLRGANSATVLDLLGKEVRKRGLSLGEAAKEIGISKSNLERHLRGEYVRSDSLAKYRLWLSGRTRNGDRQKGLQQEMASLLVEAPKRRVTLPEVQPTGERFIGVELFSGCGGLSLGFEVFNEASVFDVVLAIDIEEAMVESYNWNRLRPGGNHAPPARRVDLAAFITESEVIAFYLDHFAAYRGDRVLREDLDRAPGCSLEEFKWRIRQLDRQFLQGIAEAYEALAGTSNLGGTVLGQTSVADFFRSLPLPQLPVRPSCLGTVLWAFEVETGRADGCAEEQVEYRAGSQRLRRGSYEEARRIWDSKVAELGRKSKNRSGGGQLVSSPDRISVFLEFIESKAAERIREIWCKWYASRDALREWYFEDRDRRRHFEGLYTPERQVTVLLGGPPCQGFSRIGRGKIRSLRENGVHVQADEELGDSRNRLFEKYVLFLSALRPSVFIFENVRHFNSKVTAENGGFLASEILAEAISELSESRVEYQVSNRIVSAWEHGVPQKRERFFMAGVRRDTAKLVGVEADLEAYLLDLERRSEVPLQVALEGLPEPWTADNGNQSVMAAGVPVGALGPSQRAGADRFFAQWVSAPPPPCWTPRVAVGQADAHVCRPAREDDAALFRLMGPGTRWMDYRCDESGTLRELQLLADELVGALEARSSVAEGSDPGGLVGRLKAIRKKLDGSLSIRLLLECIRPLEGELEHHLLTETYLAKKDGNHGDWVMRLAADEPSKTMVAHMGKDTYSYVHPWFKRMLSVREAARAQTFPDWFSFGNQSMVDAFRIIGNAVPPLLSAQVAERVAHVLWLASAGRRAWQNEAGPLSECVRL